MAIPPTILVVHNFYQQPGGEDGVFEDETRLLESRGHKVIRFTAHNDAVKGRSQLKLARDTIWNNQTYRELNEIVRRERPAVAHFHNTFPLVSPAAYYAVRRAGAAVVQTLHNFRLLCPGATFFRDNRICEDCLHKPVPIPAVLHSCYRDNRPATAILSTMLVTHRAMGTWNRQVDAYIALTEFSRQKFIDGGLPANRIIVKPNFVVEDPGIGDGSGGYAIFVGRLVPEKGIDTLLAAWEKLSAAGCTVKLKIVGDGPLAENVRQAVARCPLIEWLGRKPAGEVLNLIGSAACLIFPSTWYETFGRVAVEAFAKGTPVIASRLGAMAELIDPGRTGLLFEPGNAADLATHVTCLTLNTPGWLRDSSRAEFVLKYTADINYEMLLEVYDKAMFVRGHVQTA